MDKLTVEDLDLKGKRVLMRVDFNVPLESGKVANDKRIRAALPTIKYITNAGGQLILMSHLGRPKGKRIPEMSLEPCVTVLNALLGRKVKFVDDCIGETVETVIDNLGGGDILLLENLRYYAQETDNDPDFAAKLAKLADTRVKVKPFVSDEIILLSADEEEEFAIAQANARLSENNQFLEERVEARRGSHYLLETADNIDLMDVSPKQIVSVATALIPFLEHNDANRALMGANMQRQAVPLLAPEAPVVATGMETEAARHSGQVIFAKEAGVVTEIGSVNDAGVEARYRIIITTDNGHKDEYELLKFVRTNQGTCVNQRPLVNKGDRVETGQVIADSSATENGELALGQNVVCAFMSWEGYNFEDAIIISSRLVEDDKFTSIHIAKHEVEARDTKLGPEEITRDIPNVGDDALKDLDEEGIVRIGAEVGLLDILVGKITPKGEKVLSPEEMFLRAIFGEKASEVKVS